MRSILLMKQRRGTLYLSAWRHTVSQGLVDIAHSVIERIVNHRFEK